MMGKQPESVCAGFQQWLRQMEIEQPGGLAITLAQRGFADEAWRGGAQAVGGEAGAELLADQQARQIGGDFRVGELPCQAQRAG